MLVGSEETLHLLRHQEGRPDLPLQERGRGHCPDGYTRRDLRHGSSRFSDYILPNSYYDDLLPRLAASDRDYKLAGEIKANVNEAKFRTLADAGFKEVQPGIESFSTTLLRAMDKGVKSSQCVYLLKLGRRHGVKILYNILYGFPGEEEAATRDTLRELPKMAHLDAPSTCIPVQVTRYAPLHMAPERFGLEPHTPHENYDIVFSKGFLRESGFRIEDFCYYFEPNIPVGVGLRKSHRRLVSACRTWVRDEQKRELAFTDADRTAIHDSRSGKVVEHTLGQAERACLVACDTPTTLTRLLRSGVDEAVFDRLGARGLFFRDGDEVVSLVV